MKKLTGRAAEEFLTRIYYSEDTDQASDESNKELLIYHAEKWIDNQDERFVTLLIIQWLDTIQYKGNPLFELCFEIYWKIKPDWMSFENVCGQAVEKANELYDLNN